MNLEGHHPGACERAGEQSPYGEEAELGERAHLFANPWLLCPRAFLRQEYWSRLPFPPPGDLPYPGMEPQSPVSLALASRFLTAVHLGSPKETMFGINLV